MSKLLTKFKRNAIDEIINSVNDKKVSAVTVTAAGSGYANGDDVSILGGTTFTVTTNSSGNVTSVSLVSGEVYESNVAANNVATVNTTGSGTGLTVNVAFTDETSYFVFVGGQSEYPTSDTPLEVDSEQTIRNAWNEMMFGKKASVVRMVTKHVWTSNTVYTQYDDTVDLKEENFYVVTSTRDVFKCIYNNGGLASTVEPTKRALKLGRPVREEDGYEWLYLYTIGISDYTKFVTNNYMPVLANTLIQSSAIDGAIFNVSIENNGQDYPGHSGNLLFNPVSSAIVLESGASTSNNYYKDCSISVTNDVGDTYVRKILTSNNSLQITTEAFPNNFLSNTGCSYVIGPTVTFESFTGSGAVAYSVVELGQISKIQMIDYGSDYRDANVIITSGIGFGSGAEGRVIFSPYGGHGSNVYDELYVESLGVQCTFDLYGVSNSFISDVTYRTVGVLKNPTYANNLLYDSDTFNQISTINISGSIGTFNYGELVEGIGSSSFGRFAYANSTVMRLTGVTGTFLAGEDIVGTESNARTTVGVGGDISATDLKLYSGEILYVQNIQEVTRSVTNTEQVKLVISF